MTSVFTQLDDLKEDVSDLKFPTGAKDSPARSCRDIYIGHPDFDDGRNHVWVIRLLTKKIILTSKLYFVAILLTMHLITL